MIDTIVQPEIICIFYKIRRASINEDIEWREIIYIDLWCIEESPVTWESKFHKLCFINQIIPCLQYYYSLSYNFRALYDTHFGIELFCTASFIQLFISDQWEIMVWGHEVHNINKHKNMVYKLCLQTKGKRVSMLFGRNR